jgi:hypothetical protein
MSTLVVGTIKSDSAQPPTIQRSDGTEIGTFCRAWVVFDGDSGTAPDAGTIGDSFNVSHITVVGTGEYRVNFITPLPDNSYAAFANCMSNPSGSMASSTADDFTTASFRVMTFDFTNSFESSPVITAVVFK